MLKKTPLNALHRAAGARMVDFGGWEMPVNYGSQIEEHHAVRRDAGMFDVSHMRVVDVAGGSARGFLRGALANNVDKLKESGRALYSCLLAEDGGVQDDLIVYFLREDLFRLVVNAATAEKDVAWLAALAARNAPGLSLVPRPDLAMIAVQGPSRACEDVAGVAGHRGRDRRAEALLGRDRRRTVHCAHGLHGRGRLRDRAAGGRCGSGLARAWRRPVYALAGSARATRCVSRPA